LFIATYVFKVTHVLLAPQFEKDTVTPILDVVDGQFGALNVAKS